MEAGNTGLSCVFLDERKIKLAIRLEYYSIKEKLTSAFIQRKNIP